LLADGQSQKWQFLWSQLGFAVALLVRCEGLGVWSATVTSLETWSKMFLRFFEILFSAVIGLSGVEAAANPQVSLVQNG
jgi:hypothetical protein